MRFLLSASILSFVVPFLSAQSMQLEGDTQRASLPQAASVVASERTRQDYSEELKRFGNRLYSLGQMQGLSPMSRINTVISSIEGKIEVPEDIRQEHVISWLREAVEDEKDLPSLYRLYTITGTDAALWDSIQKAKIDLVALADNTHELQVKRNIVSLLLSYNQEVPTRLLQAVGLRRFSYGCGREIGKGKH